MLTNFFCKTKAKSFITQWKRNKHQQIHSNTRERTHQCEHCSTRCFSRADLDNHVRRIHSSVERTHSCQICGNTYKESSKLRNHMALHTNRNLACDHCEKRYVRQIDLDIHLRSHTGELPFACHLCEKRFAIKVRLTYHLQKHLGVKHECGICNARFNSRGKLRMHMFKHTGMPYRCEKCPAEYSKRERLRSHIQRVHAFTPSDQELDANFERNMGKTARIRDVDVPHEEIEINAAIHEQSCREPEEAVEQEQHIVEIVVVEEERSANF